MAMRLHFTPHVPTIPVTSTVASVRQLIEAPHDFESIHYTYILDEGQRLVGVISIKEVFATAPDVPLQTFTTKKMIAVRPHTSPERAAYLAIAHNIAAVPVVDARKVFQGVVLGDTIMDILQAEHTRNVLRLAGVSMYHDASGVPNTLTKNNPSTQVRLRLPWLLLGLLGGGAAALVVEQFEHTLNEHLILAAFIPAVVYIADAVGSQTQMLFVRALSIDAQLSVWRYALRETITSIFLATILGVLSAVLTFMWLQSPEVSIIVATSIFCTVAITVFIAIALPALFARLHKDPAIASGPLATVCLDIMSLLIYFGVASIVLSFIVA